MKRDMELFPKIFFQFGIVSADFKEDGIHFG
jgi:hypothetical protein